MSVPATAVFDRAALASRLEGDEELLLEIVALFAEDGAQQAEKLSAAAAVADMAQAARVAHTIKGAAANVSALRIVEVAVRAEQAAHAGDAGGCRAAAEALEQELRAFRAAARAQGLLPGTTDG